MKMTHASTTPEVTTGNQSSLATTQQRFGSKRDVAAMLQMSTRSVDNYIANGCPHLRVSNRRLRFDMTEVRQWFSDNFRVQRRGPAGGAK